MSKLVRLMRSQLLKMGAEVVHEAVTDQIKAKQLLT